MEARLIDLSTWPRAAQFELFRTYERPHYAITSHLDVSRIKMRKTTSGLNLYRACLYAIGAGLHAVPELRTRFKGDTVTQYEAVDLSMTVPSLEGTFNFAYVPFTPDFDHFDQNSREIIARAGQSQTMSANTGARADVAYLSCLPWLDFTSLNNAIASANDCIPRISWGKIVPDRAQAVAIGADGVAADHQGSWKMAMAIEVHHALVDGQNIAEYFDATQRALDGF